MDLSRLSKLRKVGNPLKETEEGMATKLNGNSPVALDREFLRECGGRLAREISPDQILKGSESCNK